MTSPERRVTPGQWAARRPRRTGQHPEGFAVGALLSHGETPLLPPAAPACPMDSVGVAAAAPDAGPGPAWQSKVSAVPGPRGCGRRSPGSGGAEEQEQEDRGRGEGAARRRQHHQGHGHSAERPERGLCYRQSPWWRELL